MGVAEIRLLALKSFCFQVFVLGSAVLAVLNGWLIMGDMWSAELYSTSTFRRSLADFAMAASLVSVYFKVFLWFVYVKLWEFKAFEENTFFIPNNVT